MIILTPEQTEICVKHCAEIALHTRFMAVALMEADQADQIELAALFLELTGGPTLPGMQATEESAQALLDQVRSAYQPAWKQSKKGNPPRSSDFAAARAVRDLETSPTWFRRVHEALTEQGECSAEAARFLHLRRSIYLERLESVSPEQVAEFTEALKKRLLELASPKGPKGVCEVSRGR